MSAAVDPARLARSLALHVDPLDGLTYEATGGSEPHIVSPTTAGRWTCDCVDTRFHNGECKHRLAVTLSRRLDSRMIQALSVMVAS
ncbi:MAG: hypothetical protein IIB33_01655 [Chloroflexi bacterium]|nr:hypothetical protein [Chloroflexota bacterium]